MTIPIQANELQCGGEQREVHLEPLGISVFSEQHLLNLQV